MYCSKCGNQVPNGEKFCSRCGNPMEVPNPEPMNQNVNNFNQPANFIPNYQQPVNPAPSYQQPAGPMPNYQMPYTQPPQKKKWPKVLMIVGISVGGFILLIVILFAVVFSTDNKLVCTSSIGNITITFNGDEITGYMATGRITYDLDGQKAVAKRIGASKYKKQFNTWFETNTDGTCVDQKQD